MRRDACGRLRQIGAPDGGRRHGSRPRAARTVAEPDSRRRHRAGRRLDAGRQARRRRRARGERVRARSRSSALAVRAAEWRRPRRRDGGARQQRRSQGHQTVRHGPGDEESRLRDAERRSHHAAARLGWRRRARAAHDVHRGLAFAVRHGARRRRLLRRQHGRSGAVRLLARRDDADGPRHTRSRSCRRARSTTTGRRTSSRAATARGST